MRKYAQEFRDEVVARVREGGQTRSTIAKEFNIHPSLLSQWWNKANGKNPYVRKSRSLPPVARPAPPMTKPQPSPSTEPTDATDREAVAFVTGQCHAWITIAAERYGVSSRTLTQRVGALLQRT